MKQAKTARVKSDNQVTGNIGLYYVCYRLSKLGWNVMPTARNAKGVDVIIYNSDASIKWTIQVKALSRRNPVALGNSLSKILADYVIICSDIQSDSPRIFVLNRDEAKQLAKQYGENWYIDPQYYYKDLYADRWQSLGPGRVSVLAGDSDIG